MEVVLIVLAVVLLALLVLTVVRRWREHRLEARRDEAGQLRETARRHQIKAHEHAERAAEVDPDADRHPRSFNTATG
jgi:hypothetical protein